MLVEHRHATADPTTISLVRQSEAALDDGRPSHAEWIARLAIDRDAAYVPARLALGRALEALGRHADAATVYAEAARMSPFSAGVSNSLRRVWIAPLAGFGVVALLVWGVFRVIQRQFDQHTVLLGLLVSVAMLVVGTLVLLHRQRRRFASLSADDRRLLERQGAWAGLSGPGSGRLLAVAMVILLLSGAAVVFAVGTKPSLGMKVGDCFTLDGHSSIQQVSAIPCALPHGTEIYATVENPAPLDVPYPGVEAVRAAAKAGCAEAYEPYVGAPYSPSSKMWISILVPEEPYWVIGVRTSWCSLQARDGEQTAGSARGSGH
jgi:hypothetical protein